MLKFNYIIYLHCLFILSNDLVDENNEFIFI